MKKESFILKKIKAFTLMELAIGMLLTTVTAAAGFSLYLYFIKTIKKHTEDENLVKNLQGYYFQMENDLQWASEIQPMENGVILINSKKEKIIYRLEDTLLLREIPDAKTDTFKLHTASLFFSEENMIHGKVGEFSIAQKVNKQELNWQWKKEYSPAESINQYMLNDGH